MGAGAVYTRFGRLIGGREMGYPSGNRETPTPGTQTRREPHARNAPRKLAHAQLTLSRSGVAC